MKNPNYQKLAQEWFERGDDDFLFAQAGFKETGIAMDTCLLSHQAVEKYLKGYLVGRGIEPERTHVLPKILKDCIKKDEGFKRLEEKCQFLNKFYKPSRYPGGAILDFDKGSAKKSLQAAEEIIDFVEKKVKQRNA